MKAVVITGVSSGIGEATCKKFLTENYLVFGSIRDANDAKRLSAKFGQNFTPLMFDVRNPNAIRKAAKIVRKKLNGQTISALINNAGIATHGPLQYMDLDEFRNQIEIKLMGTLACVQAFLPLLGSDKQLKGSPGRIINVSSALGGSIGAPFYGAYCSSKHALEVLSECLRRELTVHGIKVVIVAPGAVTTPIWRKVDQGSLLKKYSNTEYENALRKSLSSLNSFDKSGMKVEKVAEKILLATEKKNPKVKYTLIKGLVLRLLYTAPTRLVDLVFLKYYNLQKRKSR